MRAEVASGTFRVHGSIKDAGLLEGAQQQHPFQVQAFEAVYEPCHVDGGDTWRLVQIVLRGPLMVKGRRPLRADGSVLFTLPFGGDVPFWVVSLVGSLPSYIRDPSQGVFSIDMSEDEEEPREDAQVGTVTVAVDVFDRLVSIADHVSYGRGAAFSRGVYPDGRARLVLGALTDAGLMAGYRERHPGA